MLGPDRSHNMGLFNRIYSGDRRITSDSEGTRIDEMINAGGDTAAAGSPGLIDNFSKGQAKSDGLAVEPGN